ncbi:glycosyltransferase family 4 protein [Leptospira sp. WS4.C2]
MKVLYDHQTFSIQNYGGISRYFYELITRLSQDDKIEIQTSLLFSNNEYLRMDSAFKIKPLIDAKNWIFKGNFIGKARLYNLVKTFGLVNDHVANMQSLVKARILSNDFDIFHPTYYNPYYIEWLSDKKIPVVITVYDMIHEKFPKYFLDANKTIEEKRRTINRADKIIAISESTKKDIQEFYDIPNEKIQVIHLASSLQDHREKNKIVEDLKDYILFIGNRSVYKNFAFFLDAITELFKKYPKLKLIIGGGEKITKQELLKFRELKLEDRIIHFQIEDNRQLLSLYQSVRLFVFPSLYEGFGIPLIEAMKSGCPVVCSNTSSFPEVAGEAALYFNPIEKASIFSAVEMMYENEELRKNFIELGYKQSAKFGWDNVAIQTYNLYKSLV